MVFHLIILLLFFHFEGFICENSTGYEDLHIFEDKTGYDGLEFSDVSHIINKDQCKKKDSNSFICCVKHKELICLEGTFLRNDFGINVSLSINNKTRWSDIISVSNPPAICPVNYPGVGDICLKISDIRIEPYHFCLQIVIKVHKVTVKKFDLGCFDENSNELSGREFHLLKNTIDKISMDENQSNCVLNGNYSFVCCMDIDGSG
uniref:DUF4773 domain-containing protein n=1 Tax=Clastoptera arizonana TaxID=38151 RepID=A0A1B6EA24_9HEMI